MKTWRVTWMILASIATLTLVVMLLWPPPERQASDKPTADIIVEAFRLSPDGDILIPSASVLESKVEIVTIELEDVSFPLLRVTGSVVAKLVDDATASEDHWRFATDELSSTYADWLKARAGIENAKNQLNKVQQLTEATVNYKTAVVERTKRLVGSGTVAPRELATAQSDLEQAKLQGQKDVYSAQSVLKLAEKNLESVERKFEQAGIDASVFDNPKENMTLILANVPEQKMLLVHEGQACTAQLYGYPGRRFAGSVERIGATFSENRRTMRVLFHITDQEDLLKPGMFAEIGLGTAGRPALLVPAEALLHVGNTDYLLEGDGPGRWRITACVTGESHGNRIEITSGLTAGQKIIGRGATQLKPLVMQATIN